MIRKPLPTSVRKLNKKELLLPTSIKKSEHKKISFHAKGEINISPKKIEVMYDMAKKHGITEAPFFNTKGIWN